MKALLCAALAIGFGQLASATPELELVSGSAGPITVTGSGSTVIYSNPNFNGWTVDLVFGSSNSPNLNGAAGAWGIDITSITATCTTGTCSANPLDIYLSDTGFTQPVGAGGFTTTYSSSQVGTGASTTETAWDDTTNTIFGTGALIGNVGPFTGTGGQGSASGGGPAGPGSYSLTIEDVFNAGGSAGASFSTDGLTTAAVPEPAAISLLGGVLLLLGSRLRKRLG